MVTAARSPSRRSLPNTTSQQDKLAGAVSPSKPSFSARVGCEPWSALSGRRRDRRRAPLRSLVAQRVSPDKFSFRIDEPHVFGIGSFDSRPSAFRVPLGKDLVQVAVKQLLRVWHAVSPLVVIRRRSRNTRTADSRTPLLLRLPARVGPHILNPGSPNGWGTHTDCVTHLAEVQRAGHLASTRKRYSRGSADRVVIGRGRGGSAATTGKSAALGRGCGPRRCRASP
jgi:hypothetical protein